MYCYYVSYMTQQLTTSVVVKNKKPFDTNKAILDLGEQIGREKYNGEQVVILGLVELKGEEG